MSVSTGIARYGVVGYNHRLIPAPLRGRMAFAPDWCERLVTSLRDARLADGLTFLSTCNRQEIVLSSDHPGFATELVRSEMKALLGDASAPDPYRHTGEDAVRHVLRVSASLDSLVVGERQIPQQLRRAFDAARERGWMDKALNGLARIAMENTKVIHQSTALGRESIGVFSIARDYLVEHLVEHLADLPRPPRVAVVGLGEIGLKTARTLAADGRFDVLLSSRRARTERELGRTLSARPFVSLDSFETLLLETDAVVLATGASTPLVDGRMLRRARRGAVRPLHLVDLGIPPQAAFDCEGEAATTLVNIDWFTSTGFGQKPQAREAIEQAYALVDDGVRRVADWTRIREYGPLFDSCVALAERFKAQELPKVVERDFASLPPDQRRRVLTSMHALLTAYSEGVYDALHTELGDRAASKENA